MRLEKYAPPIRFIAPGRSVLSSFLIAMFGLVPALTAFSQVAVEEEPSWKWPESRWREAVQQVRAGPRLVPDSWPEGGRVAVTLSFDLDTETLMLRNGITSPSRLSTGQYGARAGLPRILKLLERNDIQATFFVPAVTGQLLPDQVDAIVAGGRHEIGVHGWIHELAQELSGGLDRELLAQAFEYWKKRLGKPPAGIRTPSWDFT